MTTLNYKDLTSEEEILARAITFGPHKGIGFLNIAPLFQSAALSALAGQLVAEQVHELLEEDASLIVAPETRGIVTAQAVQAHLFHAKQIDTPLVWARKPGKLPSFAELARTDVFHKEYADAEGASGDYLEFMTKPFGEVNGVVAGVDDVGATGETAAKLMAAVQREAERAGNDCAGLVTLIELVGLPSFRTRELIKGLGLGYRTVLTFDPTTATFGPGDQ